MSPTHLAENSHKFLAGIAGYSDRLGGFVTLFYDS